MTPPAPIRAGLLAWSLWCSGCGGMLDDPGSSETSNDAEPLLDEGYCQDELGGLAARVVLSWERQSDTEVLLRVDKYDEHDNLIAHLMDYGEDGLDLTFVTTWTYDDRGEWTEMRQDTDGDAAPDLVKKREFDAAGHLVLELEGAVGSSDSSATASYTYDDQGRITSQTSTGSYGKEVTYEYDQDGWTVASTDLYIDGVVDSVERTLVTEGGRMVVVERDGDPDGVIDSRTKTRYDEEGRLLESISDYDADGDPDLTIIDSYDEAGNLRQETYDKDGDGDADMTLDYHYSADGRLESAETKDASGSVMASTIYSYDGDLVTEVHTEYLSGAQWSLTLGPSDPVSSWTDSDGNGELEAWATYVDCP